MPPSSSSPRRQKAPGDKSPVGPSRGRAPVEPVNRLSIELQQSILASFQAAVLSQLPDVNELRQTIQTVKGHLYDRDFAAAFGQSTHLYAYAARWSAARALAYAEILTSPDRRFLWAGGDRPFEVVCLGGGAGAEVVACIAAAREVQMTQPVNITAIDMADWKDVVESVVTEMIAVESDGLATVTRSTPKVTFIQQDLLTWDPSALAQTLATASLVTLAFTLNELFSTSIPQTTRFLLDLTLAMPPASHLLVIDSPSSYSEIRLGVGSKKYPMKYLLDHTLLAVGVGDAKWEKVEDESRWFRLAEGLVYPLALENTRYQIHVFRRL